MEPQRNTQRLQELPLRGPMSGQIESSRHGDNASFLLIARLFPQAQGGFQHLETVKFTIFADERFREGME